MHESRNLTVEIEKKRTPIERCLLQNSAGHSERKVKSGRQNKRREYDIKDCTVMDFTSSTRVVEDKTRRTGIL